MLHQPLRAAEPEGLSGRAQSKACRGERATPT